MEFFRLLVRMTTGLQFKYVVASAIAMNYAIAVDPVITKTTTTSAMVPNDRSSICAVSLLLEYRRLRTENAQSNALLAIFVFVQLQS